MPVEVRLVCSSCGKSHAAQLVTRVSPRRKLCPECYDQFLDRELGFAADVAPGVDKAPQLSSVDSPLEDAQPIVAQATLEATADVVHTPLFTLGPGHKGALFSISAGR